MNEAFIVFFVINFAIAQAWTSSPNQEGAPKKKWKDCLFAQLPTSLLILELPGPKLAISSVTKRAQAALRNAAIVE